jgi:hypothetical protein
MEVVAHQRAPECVAEDLRHLTETALTTPYVLTIALYALIILPFFLLCCDSSVCTFFGVRWRGTEASSGTQSQLYAIPFLAYA